MRVYKYGIPGYCGAGGVVYLKPELQVSTYDLQGHMYVTRECNSATI